MRIGLMVGVLVMVAGTPVAAQSRDDSTAIRSAARDYITAWYDGDATLMEQVLHPELAKRNISSDASGRARFSNMSAMAMVRATRGRTKQPPDQRLLEISLLDAQPTIATAKATSWDFIDYVHLAKVDGRWVIINDLWTGRPRQ